MGLSSLHPIHAPSFRYQDSGERDQQLVDLSLESWKCPIRETRDCRIGVDASSSTAHESHLLLLRCTKHTDIISLSSWTNSSCNYAGNSKSAFHSTRNVEWKTKRHFRMRSTIRVNTYNVPGPNFFLYGGLPERKPNRIWCESCVFNGWIKIPLTLANQWLSMLTKTLLFRHLQQLFQIAPYSLVIQSKLAILRFQTIAYT